MKTAGRVVSYKRFRWIDGSEDRFLLDPTAPIDPYHRAPCTNSWCLRETTDSPVFLVRTVVSKLDIVPDGNVRPSRFCLQNFSNVTIQCANGIKVCFRATQSFIRCQFFLQIVQKYRALSNRTIINFKPHHKKISYSKCVLFSLNFRGTSASYFISPFSFSFCFWMADKQEP